MANPVEEMLLRQLNVNPTSIERWILLGVLRSGRFYRSIRQKICPRQPDGRLRQDFLTPRYNQLYHAADRFWRLLDRRPLDRDMDIPRPLLETSLLDDVELGMLDAEEHQLLITEMNQFFYSAAQVNPLLLEALNGPLKIWLDMRMSTMAVNAAHLDAQTTRLSMSRLNEVMKTYKAAATMESGNVVSVQSELNDSRTFHRRIQSSLPGLTFAMGGYGRREVVLIAGANGAGKTVLACQEAVAFCKQQLNVAYFTTEQTPIDLIYRTLCNFGGIELKHFTHRAELKELNQRGCLELPNLPDLFRTDPAARLSLDGYLEEVAPRLKFVDWSEGAAPVVQDAFDPAMEAVAESLGAAPDVVIFDWIGGAMERGKDKDHLRHYYYDAVNYMVNYAKMNPRVAMIVLAQIDKAKAEKANLIKMIHLAECKSMSDNVTGFVGISSMGEPDRDEGIMLEKPRSIQYLNVDKARSGPKGPVKVMRKFERQRFMTVENNDRADSI